MLSIDLDIGDIVLKDGWDVDLRTVSQARNADFVTDSDGER